MGKKEKRNKQHSVSDLQRDIEMELGGGKDENRHLANRASKQPYDRKGNSMTDEQLIEFKKLSMQEGKLNLSWFADYVENAVRQECAELAEKVYGNATIAAAIRGQQ